MRYLSPIAAAALVAATIPLSLAVWRLPASASDTAQTTTCQSFASVKWVNPAYDLTGNEYVVTVMQNAIPCAQATKWAQKFVAQHIGGAPGSVATLKGGPPGYDCVGFPDSAGNAYRGRCVKPGEGAVPGFSWDGKM